MILVAVCGLFSFPAQAQQVCDTHDNLVEVLATRYGESRIAVGLSSTGHLIETFSAADGSTWTIAFTDPSGRSCLMAAGTNWETQTPAKPMSAPL